MALFRKEEEGRVVQSLGPLESGHVVIIGGGPGGTARALARQPMAGGKGREGQHSNAVRRVQYDAYMLDAVEQRGISVIPARAYDLEFHDEHVVVYTDNSPFEAQVVVGAFGMDEGSSAMFDRLTPYRPPQALSSIVTKYHPKQDAMDEFGPTIHAFLPANPGIEFGGVTPKGNHLTVNIARSRVDAA